MAIAISFSYSMSPQTQNICITFVQCWTNVFDFLQKFCVCGKDGLPDKIYVGVSSYGTRAVVRAVIYST